MTKDELLAIYEKKSKAADWKQRCLIANTAGKTAAELLDLDIAMRQADRAEEAAYLEYEAALRAFLAEHPAVGD